MSGIDGSHPTIIIGCGTPLGGDELLYKCGWQQAPLSRWLDCSAAQVPRSSVLQDDKVVCGTETCAFFALNTFWPPN